MPSQVLASLEAHLKEHHVNKYALNVESKDLHYSEWKENYSKESAEPLAIVRPQSAEDVAVVVSYCVEQRLDFHVRAGGHDLFGRSTVQDSVMIDLRDMNYVRIDDDKLTAKVGGGNKFEHLVEELEKEEMFTPSGIIGTVGYVGWAALGGYGPFGPQYGLGLDQIVGAKVVNAEGKIVTADARMLKGIRGACGNFGVIVEVTVKVYPLPKIKAGQIIYESSNLVQTFRTVMTNYQKLLMSKTPPQNLYLQPIILHFPGLGPTLFFEFVWSGLETPETEEWRSYLANLAPTMSTEVTEKTPLAIIKHITPLVPLSVFGGPHTAYLSEITPEVVDIMVKHIGLMPDDPSAALAIHSIRGKSCESPFPESVWNHREPHLLVEILGLSSTEEGTAISQAWAENFRNDLVKAGAALEGTYVSLTPPKYLNLEKIYGDKLKELRELKEEYDPKRIFRHAVPPL